MANGIGGPVRTIALAMSTNALCGKEHQVRVRCSPVVVVPSPAPRRLIPSVRAQRQVSHRLYWQALAPLAISCSARTCAGFLRLRNNLASCGRGAGLATLELLTEKTAQPLHIRSLGALTPVEEHRPLPVRRFPGVVLGNLLCCKRVECVVRHVDLSSVPFDTPLSRSASRRSAYLQTI